MRGIIAMVLLLGCTDNGTATDVDTDSDTSGGRCGAVTTHVVTLDIEVVVDEGGPVEGATVRLEERAWSPGTLAEDTTGTDGTVTLADVSITGVEGCWGLALDYHLVVQDGEVVVEETMNSALFNAVNGDGTVTRTVYLP